MSHLIAPLSASSIEGPPLYAVIAAPCNQPRITPPHTHRRGQLLSSNRGLLSVDAGIRRMVIPPRHAIWIPPDLPHGLCSHGAFSGWSIYASPSSCLDLPDQARVIPVSGLLRECVLRASEWNGPPDWPPEGMALATLVFAEIRRAPSETLALSLPVDARLRAIAHALADAPEDDGRMGVWAARSGMSPRNFSRRFNIETGMNFTAWRHRLKMLRAMELLATGQSVKNVALALGFSNVSAFISLFRKHFGCTPGRLRIDMD